MHDADILLLAAGFGKRLLPLTEHTPKPLLRVGGRCIIDYSLDLIARSGFKRVIINLHYLGEQIRKHVGNGGAWGLEVEYSEERVILDTGGAIKNVESRLCSQTLITLNSDTLFGDDFSLRGLVDFHFSLPTQPLATLVLRHDPQAASYGEVGVNTDGKIVQFLGKQYSAGETDKLMFAGIQLLTRQALSFMPNAGSIFSVTRDTHVRILESRGLLSSFIYDGYWSDLGTPERLALASKRLEEQPTRG